MKKFLIGFGGVLILLGTVGLINHISLTFKAVETEREMYGGSVQFMILQMVSSLGPYLMALIGGGIIIALVAFLNAYEKRNDLTSQLIDALTTNGSIEKISHTHLQPLQNETKPLEEPIEDEISNYEHTQNDRLYWNG